MLRKTAIKKGKPDANCIKIKNHNQRRRVHLEKTDEGLHSATSFPSKNSQIFSIAGGVRTLWERSMVDIAQVYSALLLVHSFCIHWSHWVQCSSESSQWAMWIRITPSCQVLESLQLYPLALGAAAKACNNLCPALSRSMAAMASACRAACCACTCCACACCACTSWTESPISPNSRSVGGASRSPGRVAEGSGAELDEGAALGVALGAALGAGGAGGTGGGGGSLRRREVWGLSRSSSSTATSSGGMVVLSMSWDTLILRCLSGIIV